jgi:hypothetical protein
MTEIKRARKNRRLAKGDIKDQRNELTSELFMLNNYDSLSKAQQGVIDKIIKDREEK